MRSTLLLFFALTLFASPALTAEPPGTRTITATLQAVFAAGRAGPQAGAAAEASLAMLVEEGAALGAVLVLETLPRGDTSRAEAVLAEVELRDGARSLRYPVKLARREGTWRVTWAPGPDYTRALLDVVRGDRLPSAGDTAWSDAVRLPAMPLVVTPGRWVTPFGVIDAVDDGAGQDVVPPADLARHAQRWVSTVLEDAPAPAGFDVLADAQLSWRELTQTLMAAGAVGLFRVHLVGQDAATGQLRAVVANAPLFEAGRVPGHMVMPVVGQYPLGDGRYGFRIVVGDRFLRPEPGSRETGCPAEMSFCAAGADDFAARLVAGLRSLDGFEPGSVTHVMFATVADTPLQTALEYIDHTTAALSLPAHRLFIGFIQK